MATLKTIGNAASGADYAADSDAINAWEDGQDGESGDQTGRLITDVYGTYVTFDGWGAVVCRLESDGTRRTYYADTDSSRMMRLDSTSPDYELADITWDFNGYGDTYGCIFSYEPITLHAWRCRFTGNDQNAGVRCSSTSGTHGVIWDSCIFDNHSGGNGYSDSNGSAHSTLFRNCGFFKNGGKGIDFNDDDACDLYNCISMANSSSDFDDGHPPTGDYCISSDTTASSFCTNYLQEKTSYTSYFNDWGNDDFTLKSDDPWGSIGYDSSNQAPDDFDGTSWSNNNIGPYEFEAAGGIPRHWDYYHRAHRN